MGSWSWSWGLRDVSLEAAALAPARAFILPMFFRMPPVCPVSLLRSSLYPIMFAFYAASSVSSLSNGKYYL